jgi:hypothetical protein
VAGKKIPQRVQILHYIRDHYGKFQYPDIFGSILECGLLMTLLTLPTPAPQSTEAIAKNQKSLSLPSSEVSTQPASQPNRTFFKNELKT